MNPSRRKFRAIWLTVLVCFAGVAFLGGVSTGLASAGNSGAIPIASCTEITAPGTYEVTSDISTFDSSHCIEITSDDVVLEGQDHVLHGHDNGHAAIAASNVRNITIRNLTARQFEMGVRFWNVDESEVSEVFVDGFETVHAHSNGIVLYSGSENNTIRDNGLYGIGDTSDIDQSGNGIYLADSPGNTILDNTVYDAAYVGIKLQNSSHNNLTKNSVRAPGFGSRSMRAGIRVRTNSNDNLLLDNEVQGNSGQSSSLRQGVLGIEISSADNNRLEGNTISGFHEDGIVLGSRFVDSPYTGTRASDHNVLLSNVLRSNYGGGIAVLDGRHNNLTDNTLFSNGGGSSLGAARHDGIHVEANHTVLGGNSVAYSERYGIYLEGSSTVTSRNDSVYSNTGWGMYLASSGSIEVSSLDLDGTSSIESDDVTFVGQDVALERGVSTAAPAGYRSIGVFLKANATAANGRMFLNVSYGDSDVAAINESSLRLWRHDGSWSKVSGVNGVNTVENYVYGNVTQFSTFALLAKGDTSPPRLSNAVADDRPDSNGEVRDGDVVDLRVDVIDSEQVTVTANASAFGAGTVSLTDGNDDGQFEGTFTVDALNSSGSGAHQINVTAEDAAGNRNSTLTNALELNTSGKITVAPTSYDFGLLASQSHTETVNVTITNVGVATLSVSGSSLSGPNAGDFSITRGGGPISLNPGATHNVTVALDPSSAGRLSATLSVTSDDPQSATMSVTLTGEGIVGMPISTCRPINSSGTYLLTQDLVDMSGAPSSDASNTATCLEVTSGDVTLLGNGHTIDGIGASSPGSVGVYVHAGQSLSNVTIEGFSLTDWQQGIRLSGSQDARIARNRISGTNKGISVSSPFGSGANEGAVLENNTIEDNTFGAANGIQVDSATNTTISNTHIANNTGDGILIRYGHGSEVFNTTIANSGGSAVSTFQAHVSGERVTLGSGTIIAFDAQNAQIHLEETPPSPPPSRPDIGKFVNVTETSPGGRVFLNVSYASSDVVGHDERTLRIWRHDGSWSPVTGTNGVNTAENYVYANLTRFSTFAPLLNGTQTDNTPPTVANALAVDRGNGDGNVSDGDRVEVLVNASDASGIVQVWADATDFGAGQVTLTDGDGDGRYNGTFVVDLANSSGPGTYGISITAKDGAMLTTGATTNSLQIVASNESGGDEPSDGTGITKISSCTDITQPGRYVLTSDIVNSSAQYCINITSSDVILDGLGHRVDSDGSRYSTAGSVSVGVNVRNPPRAPSNSARLHNVTVANLVVSDWENGIWFRNVSESEIVSNRATDTANFAIAADSASSNLTIAHNHVSGTFKGIIVHANATDVVRNAVVNVSGHGIWTAFTHGVLIAGNEIENATYNGVVVQSGTHADVVENNVSGAEKGIYVYAYNRHGLFGPSRNDTIAHNRIENVTDSGITVTRSEYTFAVRNELHNATTGARVVNSTYVGVLENEVTESSVSVEITKSPGPVGIFGNRLDSSGRAAVVIGANTWATHVPIHDNEFLRVRPYNYSAYGVLNRNRSAVANATENWWGRIDGPSSPWLRGTTPPLRDPVTNAAADGSGVRVSNGSASLGTGQRNVSNVHFDPAYGLPYFVRNFLIPNLPFPTIPSQLRVAPGAVSPSFAQPGLDSVYELSWDADLSEPRVIDRWLVGFGWNAEGISRVVEQEDVRIFVNGRSINTTEVSAPETGGEMLDIDDDGSPDSVVGVRTSAVEVAPGDDVRIAVGNRSSDALIWNPYDRGSYVIYGAFGNPDGVVGLAVDDVQVSYEMPEPDPDVVSLTLEANRTSAESGRPVRFSVSRADSGEPVDATVTIGDQTYVTDRDGTLVHTFEQPGTYAVSASKPNTTETHYRPDSLDITIESSARFEGVISLNRTSFETTPGESFWIAVQYDTSVATQTTEVSEIGFTLEYDPSVLTATAVTRGSFLRKDGEGSTVRVKQINDSAGTVDYVETQNVSTGVAGAGSVAYVKFNASNVSTEAYPTRLSFSNVSVSAPQGSIISTVRRNGTVQVGGGPIIEPLLESSVNNVGSPIAVTVYTTARDSPVAAVELRLPGQDEQEAESVRTGEWRGHVVPEFSTWAGSDYGPTEMQVTAITSSFAQNTTTIPLEVYIAGDANGDGEVDIFDAVAIGQAWNTERGSGSYSDGADLNNDGVVDIFDAVIIGQHWKTTAS